MDSDLETRLANLMRSKNPARFQLTTLECTWPYKMAQSLVGSKNNLLDSSFGHVGVDGLVKFC
jgi:hypothetical protein